MNNRKIHAVTGAFGFSGKYITQRLLDKGHRVITLTNSLQRANPFGEKVNAFPFDFDDPANLTRTLQGTTVLYNTYWVRFNHKKFTYADAIKNTATLFEAAQNAGVQRIVHISITNPSEDSQLEYFSGKAKIERNLKASGISYAILRPAVLFGEEDILINNIAWALRRLPVFAVFGKGHYRIQPIYVDDLAEIAVAEGNARENNIIDCIGPETFTYRGLVEEIGDIIGIRRSIISIPPTLGFMFASIIGKLVKDVLITRDEIDGLMQDLLYVESAPIGKTKLTDWVHGHSGTLGRQYASELARRIDRKSAY
jgi:NADH dehydrogenase